MKKIIVLMGLLGTSGVSHSAIRDVEGSRAAVIFAAPRVNDKELIISSVTILDNLVVNGSTITSGGGSAGISSVTVNTSQFSGNGINSANALTLKSSSVTLKGSATNVANALVMLDGSGKLPAVDGSQLTNLPSGGSSVLHFAVGEVTGGAGPAVMRTYTLPANSLVSGKRLRIRAMGYHDAPGSPNEVQIKWGSNTSIAFSVSGTVDYYWLFDVDMYYVSSATQYAIINQQNGTQDIMVQPYQRFPTELLEDTTAPIEISVLGSANIVNESFIVELM